MPSPVSYTHLGQAELAEDTVHDESNTGHVTNVFQDGKQEEQNQHLGNEAQNLSLIHI